MKSLSLAKCYALAYYPFIEQQFDEMVIRLEMICSLLSQDKGLSVFVNHPGFTYEKKTETLKNILSDNSDKEIERLLALLVKKRKILILAEILEELKNLHARNQDIERVIIKSSDELSEDEKKNLIFKISTSINKKVFAEYIIDKKLISGLVIKVADRKIDYSLRGKLNGLKELLALSIS